MNVMLPQPITRSADHRYSFWRRKVDGWLWDGKDAPPDPVQDEQVTVPGVTTILRVLDKSDGLVPWAARETAGAALRLFRDGTLQSLTDAVGDEGVIKAMTDRHRWQRDEAAQLGSEVHRLAEGVVKGEGQVAASPDIVKRVMAYADWWQASGWTRPLTEVMGVNPSVGYGGTLDLMARDADGRLVLADLKTGRRVYRESILQVGPAYGDFTYIQVPDGDGWKIVNMPTMDRYVILHVTLDGVREIELTVGQAERMAWLDCVDLHRWTQKVKGRL